MLNFVDVYGIIEKNNRKEMGMVKRIIIAVLLVSVVISCVSCKNTSVKANTSKVNSSSISSSSVVSSSITSSVASSSKSVSSSKASSSSKVSSSTKASSITPEKTAFQYFDDADKKMDALKSFAYQENGAYKISSSAISVDVTTLSNVKADTLNNQKRFTVEQTSTVNGQQKVSSACYNGKYYVKQDDGSYIEKTFKDYLVDFPDVWRQDESNDIPNILSTDIVSSTKGTYSGGVTVSLVVKGTKFSTYFNKFISEDGATVGSANIDDVTVDVKINNNGYFDETNFHMKGRVSVTINDQTTLVNIDATYKQTINNPGTAVAVTLPSNLTR